MNLPIAQYLLSYIEKDAGIIGGMGKILNKIIPKKYHMPIAMAASIPVVGAGGLAYGMATTKRPLDVNRIPE